jgi:hypothetical protein
VSGALPLAAVAVAGALAVLWVLRRRSTHLDHVERSLLVLLLAALVGLALASAYRAVYP